MDRLPEFLSIGEFHIEREKINLYNSTKDDNLESAFQIFTFHLAHSLSSFNFALHTGQLSGWDLTVDDIILLKGILKSSNSCLTLSPANFNA